MSPVAILSGMMVEIMTTMGESNTSKPRMRSNNPATSRTPKAVDGGAGHVRSIAPRSCAGLPMLWLWKAVRYFERLLAEQRQGPHFYGGSP